jgi:hypothetical protein
MMLNLMIWKLGLMSKCLGIIFSELVNDCLPMITAFDQNLIPDIEGGMTPGALGEQFNHSTDVRIAFNQDDIPFLNNPVEAVHVVYHGLLIISAWCLKASEDIISQVLG